MLFHVGMHCMWSGPMFVTVIHVVLVAYTLTNTAVIQLTCELAHHGKRTVVTACFITENKNLSVAVVEIFGEGF